MARRAVSSCARGRSTLVRRRSDSKPPLLRNVCVTFSGNRALAVRVANQHDHLLSQWRIHARLG